MTTERESIKVLRECIMLQDSKSRDYQNPNSNVVQAQHYRRGIDSIHDIINGKMLRAQSLLESGSVPNHESLEDTYKDMINYCSFAVSYLRGRMEGQSENRDVFNKPRITAESLYNPIITKPLRTSDGLCAKADLSIKQNLDFSGDFWSEPPLRPILIGPTRYNEYRKEHVTDTVTTSVDGNLTNED